MSHWHTQELNVGDNEELPPTFIQPTWQILPPQRSMKAVETQDLASLRVTQQFVSLDFHIKSLSVFYIDQN